MQRLFLLDAFALIYRGYYALIRSPRVTSTGMDTSAIFGFVNTLYDLLRKEDPSHIAVCFDPAGPTFRHEEYPEYKAQRDKQPEAITVAIPYIKRILKAFHIPVVEVEGFEADDVIGTLSRHAEKAGFETFMMTPDKDYGQLVTDKVFMYRPALRGEGFEIRGPQQVCERYGIDNPRQVIDLLALEGDTSDNIPGIQGIGPKTAQNLIKQWGSIENLIEHVGEVKGVNGRRLAENIDNLRLYKRLVTIRTDVPLPSDLTPDTLKRREEDVEELLTIFRELEFRSFIQRLNKRNTLAPSAVGGNTTEAEAKDAPTEPYTPSLFDAPVDGASTLTTFECPVGSYSVADTQADIIKLVNHALEASEVGVSLYAVGNEAMAARLEGLAIAHTPCQASFVPLPADKEQRQAILSSLEPLFTSQATICCEDVKRAYVLLRREGVEWSAPYFDTAVAHYLVDAEGRHNLPELMGTYLHLESPYLPDPKNWHKESTLSPADLATRFCHQADAVLRLRRPLLDAVAEMDMTPLLNDIELPMVRVLADMELTGVSVDVDELYKLRDEYLQRLNTLESHAFELAGEVFNIASPTQVGRILFDKLQLDPKAKKTSTGQYSTTEAILEKHRNDHPLVQIILDIRKLRKLVSTYLDTLPTLVNKRTGKIHTTFNQTVTATGRISSTNPNLQNLPIRTDDGREIRRAFIAEPGSVIMSSDYSQIELRLIADISGDPDMTEAFLSGDDIHRATAAKIYHVAPEDVTDNQRRNAKTANFGSVYGISAFGLSERLGIPRAEAKELIDGYFNTYPHIRAYIERVKEQAHRDGYVETLFHRRRRLPDINSRSAAVRGFAERNAVNAPIQGTAADIIKIAMITIADEINRRGLRSRMVMQVHDELVFNVHPDELHTMQTLVSEAMTGAYHGRIPLTIGTGIGPNWLAAHS